MSKIFYIGLAVILLFEFLKQYFIMPMPGSQNADTITFAYFLYHYRWLFRGIFAVIIITAGFKISYNGARWLHVAALLLTVTFIFLLNFKLTADRMFLQPQKVVMKTRFENKVAEDRLVIAVEYNGEARAYPIEYLTYHHQVRDIIAGKPIMVTYCSVCRTGRVYKPIVGGRIEEFRLVGMDHFNAMFEDATTKSWWRQATGEAIAGPLKGAALEPVESSQMTISKWLELHPSAKILQPDEASAENYNPEATFEKGRNKGALTRTDSLSWKEKSWVVGIEIGKLSKAYDWNYLKQKRIINDSIGHSPVVIVLSVDSQSFVAFQRSSKQEFTAKNDTLFSGESAYNFSGIDLGNPSNHLAKLNAYQEFWHSWRTFHPGTTRFIDH